MFLMYNVEDQTKNPPVKSILNTTDTIKYRHTLRAKAMWRFEEVPDTFYFMPSFVFHFERTCE